MAKKIEIVGAKPRKIEVVDKPKRRIEPSDLAVALGANTAGGQTAANLDLVALADLGTQLLGRLRSSGGRPALPDATETCRVPLSAEDLKALETITDQIAQTTGTKASPGQVASIIVREYLTTGRANAQESKSSVLDKTAVRKEAAGKLDLERIQQHIDAIATWVPRLGEIMAKARTIHNSGSAIESRANEIKDDIEMRVGEVLTLLRRDG